MASSGPLAAISEQIQDLEKLNQRLGRGIAKLDTKASSKDIQLKVQKEMKEAKALCEHILNDIRDAGHMDGVNKQLLQKLTKQMQTQMQAVVNHEQRMPVHSVGSSVDERQPLHSAGGADFGRRSSHADQQLQEQEEHQFNFIDLDVAEAHQRAEGIRQIERDMHDVHEMFKDLNEIVNEQQAPLDTITDNVLSTKERVMQSHEEILKAEKYQSSTRKKQCCILFIVITLLAVVSLGIWVVAK